jgi:hypothetical protein
MITVDIKCLSERRIGMFCPVGIACWTHRRYTVYETIYGTVEGNVVLMLLISLYYDLTVMIE